MRRSSETAISLAVLAVAAFEIASHLLLGKNLIPPLLNIYLHRDVGGKPFIAGTVDHTIPSAFLGLVTGWAGSKWSLHKLCATALGLGAFVAVLQPVLRFCIGAVGFGVLWCPKSVSEFVYYFTFLFFTALIVLGCFVYEGVVLKRYFEEKGATKKSKRHFSVSPW
jgi:uncharacterized membrane protein YbhN (UPF0104 family)